MHAQKVKLDRLFPLFPHGATHAFVSLIPRELHAFCREAKARPFIALILICSLET